MTSQPRITVIGVGGAGGNAVNNMIRSNLEGVEFLVCNTDAQALSQSVAERRIQLGLNTTKGLGAGSRPDVGRASAEEALEELLGYLEGSNMVFITAGMGGGTGTGAAPVIARAAREHNILTVGVVTKPFQFEGAHRMKTAEAGIQELQQYVDTLIVIPNQNLFRVANDKTTFADAFKMADEVLHSGVRGITDLIVMPGLINLDFADIRTVMSEMGKAMMGTGEGSGDRRAIEAAEAAISNPLLDEVSLKGARAMLVNITAGPDIALFEVDEVVNRVRTEVDPDANVIFGSTFDPNLEGKLRVSVVATGINADAKVTGTPFQPAAQRYAPRPAPTPAPVPEPQPEAVAESAPPPAPEPVAEPEPPPAPAPFVAQEPVPEPAPIPAPVPEPPGFAAPAPQPSFAAGSAPQPQPEAPGVKPSSFEIRRGGVNTGFVRPVSPYALNPGQPGQQPPLTANIPEPSPAPTQPKPIDLPPTLSGRLEIERVLGSIAASAQQPQQTPPRAASPPPLFGQQPLAAGPKDRSVSPQPEEEPKRNFSLFERLTGAARRAEREDSDG